MRKLLFAVACCGLLFVPALAQDIPPQLLNLTNTDGVLEGGWVVSIPAGSSDYFNERYDYAVARPFAGVGIGSADFGAGTGYPTTGMFVANLGVDASGNTPDLTAGVSAGFVAGGGAVFNYVYGSFGGNNTLSGTQHVVVQFPPGDSGLLGVGANTDNVDTASFAGWTLDGYTTPANDFSATADWGLHCEVDVITELGAGGGCAAELRIDISLADETGDFVTQTVGAGGDLEMYFATSCSGTLWILFVSFLGAPVQPVTGILPTFGAGGGAFIRAGTTWGTGLGGLTLNFVGVGGVPGVKGTVHVSSEITLITLPDPGCNWGIKDDGTYETGWVVSIPSGSSDYFGNWMNCLIPPGVSNVTDIEIAVMDFGTTATGYPIAGACDANFGLDPSGWTGDLTSIVASVAPFTFPPGTFASTSGLNIVNDFPDVPYGSFADDNIHGFLQYPPGDSGLLGTGGDTTPSPGIAWGAHWTLDGWATPTNRFDTTAGWGIRLGSN
jgi:hypothetical protein